MTRQVRSKGIHGKSPVDAVPFSGATKISVGIEGTFEPFSRRDTLSVTRHFDEQRVAGDFDLARELRLDEVRYPIPWHRVERRPGSYDWSEVVWPYARQMSGRSRSPRTHCTIPLIRPGCGRAF